MCVCVCESVRACVRVCARARACVCVLGEGGLFPMKPTYWTATIEMAVVFDTKSQGVAFHAVFGFNVRHSPLPFEMQPPATCMRASPFPFARHSPSATRAYSLAL